MATPVFEDLPADTWTKIATNVTQGQVHLIKTGPNVIRRAYIQPSGDPAPADDPSLGIPAFDEGTSEIIQFTAGADIYMRPEAVASRVRVDLG
jgi:hypothetical protein